MSRCRPLAATLLALVAMPALALDPAVPFRDYELDRWGVEHGLPQITVMSIVQDHSGYLWVGTQNGIARFDGVRFVTYDRATTGVDTTMAVGGVVDARNRVWFGTPRGALMIDGGTVTEVGVAGERLSVRAVALAMDGGLLFGTERGIHTLGADGLVPLWTVGTPTWALHVEAGVIWAGGVGALWRMQDGAVSALQLPEREARITHIVRRGAVLWLGTHLGLYAAHPDTGQVERLLPDLIAESIESLAVDGDGNTWVGTAERMLRLRPDGGHEVLGEAEFAGRPWVLAIHEDTEGDLWFGTRRESLYRARNSPSIVRNERDGLSDPFVWSLLADGDGLLVGTNSNLSRLGADLRFRELVPGTRLPNPSVYDLAREPDGSLWLGTRAGLARLRGSVVEVPPALQPLRDKQVTGVLRVADADWWIATLDGLFRFRAGVLQTVIAPAGTAHSRIRCLALTADGSLLIGTEAGVRELRGPELSTPAWAAALEGSFVSRILALDADTTVLATLDAGLGVLRDGHLLMLGLEHGLPTRNAWTLDVVDGHLYLGSIVGVYRIPLTALPDPRQPAPARVASQVVAESTGRVRTLQGFACCNGGAAARSVVMGRHIFYPSTNGVVRIDTAAIPPVPRPPRAVIEMLGNAGARVRADGPQRIRGDSRDVTIEYTGLSLIESHAIEFRYRLDGYDADWVDAGTRRIAYYTHLPPGEYRFHVQARHPLGEWSADPEPLAIEVVPHWLERTSVRVLALLLLLLAVAATWRLRLRELHGRQLQLEAAVADRTRELARANERLRTANQALALESQTDPLTGLYNRRFVMESRYARGGARASDACGVLLLDLDHFKDINDRLGHATGDAVLCQLADLLRTTLRDGDVVARWGGEEFLLLLPGVDQAAALALAGRLRAVVAEQAFTAGDGSNLHLTCSIGVARHPPGADLPDAFHLALDLADAALYRAKRDGRDQVWGLELHGTLDLAQGQHLTAAIDRLAAEGRVIWVR